VVQNLFSVQFSQETAMKHRVLSFAVSSLLLIASLSLSVPLAAQSEIPLATIANDEGGVALVTGTLPISNPYVKLFGVQPIIILEDQAGFVDRNVEYTFPTESQVLAQFTTDFYADAPVGYRLALPIIPGGGQRDVDHDSQADPGVQIFAVAYWDNIIDDPFLNELEAQGWSTAYASTRTSIHPDTLMEVIGGQALVYAPDDQQGFPSSFGADAMLFTDDDPIVRLPAGYTLVDFDTDPFTFDRSREVVLDLNEPESSAPDDFSAMTYTEAFDALIEKGRNEYAYTDLKNIDWAALAANYRPLFEAAEKANDPDAYLRALRLFTYAIPDGHVYIASYHPILGNDVFNEAGGGLGLALVELDDGRVLVNYVGDGTPAAEAGIQPHAEMLELNGLPVNEAIDNAIAYTGPYSSDFETRLQKVRFATRFPVGVDVTLTYRNPDAAEATTVTLRTIQETASYEFTSYYRDLPDYALPIEYRFLPESGYGYVRLNSFRGNEQLIFNVWDFFMEKAIERGVQGIIIDVRQNSGGSSGIGYRIASYFFAEEIEIGYGEGYNPEIDAFFYDERFPSTIHPDAAPDRLRFDGHVAVLVGPACASACDQFAHAMTFHDRTAIVGQYPTNGLGGGWLDTYMPEGVTLALTTGRAIDLDGNVIIEGAGVQPTVRVPVTEETAFSDGDHIMKAAIDYLNAELGR
jgi:carboxyl-terminal processing protease